MTNLWYAPYKRKFAVREAIARLFEPLLVSKDTITAEHRDLIVVKCLLIGETCYERAKPRLPNVPGGRINIEPSTLALVLFPPALLYLFHPKKVYSDLNNPNVVFVGRLISIAAVSHRRNITADACLLSGFPCCRRTVGHPLRRPAPWNHPSTRIS